VFIRQDQPDKVFKFLIAVDIYQGADKKRYKVWVDQKADTLIFPANSKPDLINVDADKLLLCEKTDHKTLDNFIFQYKNAGLYVDRREAIDFASGQKDVKALNLMESALKDSYQGIRIYAIQKLSMKKDSVKRAVEPLLLYMAMNDPKSLVKAGAIAALGKYKKITYKDLFLKSINDSSYSIAGNALLALGSIDSVSALGQAGILSAQHVKGALSDAIDVTLYKYANESEFDTLAVRFEKLPLRNAKFALVQPFADFLKRVKDTAHFRKGIDLIVNFRDSIPMEYRQMVIPYFNDVILKGIANVKQSSGMTEQADYVNSKLPVKPKAKEGNEDH
jgi:aminopeptidase N